MTGSGLAWYTCFVPQFETRRHHAGRLQWSVHKECSVRAECAHCTLCAHFLGYITLCAY
jgi:hypothetical protein